MAYHKSLKNKTVLKRQKKKGNGTYSKFPIAAVLLDCWWIAGGIAEDPVVSRNGFADACEGFGNAEAKESKSNKAFEGLTGFAPVGFVTPPPLRNGLSEEAGGTADCVCWNTEADGDARPLLWYPVDGGNLAPAPGGGGNNGTGPPTFPVPADRGLDVPLLLDERPPSSRF